MILARRLVLAVVALVAAGLVLHRVLAPAEVLATASGADPVVAGHGPGVTGRTAAAPLIVADRIRVFAAERQVRADAPVDARTSYTPRWSLRRWPQRVTGVVAVGGTVVTRWSDGALIALDGRTGTVAWRASGPAAPAPAGLRTGASTVWAPAGLFTAGAQVLVAGGGRVAAYAGGGRLWSVPACADGFTTAGGRYVCPGGAYDAATGAVDGSWPVGPFTALGCQVARSGCEGLRDGAGRGWLTTGAAPLRTPALDAPGATVAEGLPLTVTGSAVTAQRWRWSDPAGGDVRVLGGAAGKVYLLTAGRRLVTVAAATGAASSFPLAVGAESTDWLPGGWQVTASHVAVERLRDVHHYFAVETVVIAAT